MVNRTEMSNIEPHCFINCEGSFYLLAHTLTYYVRSDPEIRSR